MSSHKRRRDEPAFIKPYRHVLTLSEDLLFAPGGPFSRVTTNDQSVIRVNNRKAMDRLLYENDGLTKQELVEKLSLSLPTVTGILQEMQDDGLIVTKQEQSAGAGRPPVRYLLDRRAHIFVSVAVTESYVRLLVTDAFCAGLLEAKLPLQYEDSKDYWETLCGAVLGAIREADTQPAFVAGVNFLFPCPVDPVESVVYDVGDITLRHFDIDRLEADLGIAVYVNNLYDAAAYQLVHEGGRGENLCYVNISGEISSVMIAGRRIFRTGGSAPGDAGHTILVPMGRRCPCGKTGCAVGYCSTDFLEAAYGEPLRTFFEKLEREGPNSPRVVVWHEYLSFLANFLANQSSAFRVPVFLGGRLAEFLGDSAELLKRLVDEYLASPGAGTLHVVTGDEDLALRGGIQILFQNYI